MDKQNYPRLIIVALFVSIAYIQTFIWLIIRWIDNNSYYTHGFLIPLISTIIVYSKRRELSKIKIKPDNSGWSFFITGIFIHILSSIWQVGFSSGFSLIIVLIGIVLLFLGKEFFKHIWFPLFFLCFMIPLPLVFISVLAFKLKILASYIAVLVVNSFGMNAVREGSIIKTMNSYLVLEDPCSGMRSLITLVALAALIAYLSKMSIVKKTVLVFLSIPVAIITNTIRILALALAIEIYGMGLAFAITDRVIGLLVFIFALLGLFFLRSELK